MLPPNQNDKLRLDYKKWVVDGLCAPQTAASLMLGLNPDVCIVKDKSDWRAVTIKVKEVQQISDVLCC